MTLAVQQELAKYYEHIDFGFDEFGDNGKVDSGLKLPTVDYDFLSSELQRLINIVDNNLFIDDKYPSLFIFGPTGVGKTEIVQKLAEDNGFIYHKLELQKIPEEQIGGFPYLGERKSEHSVIDDEKVVRTAHPTMLPPSDHDGKWILHLDEFNKADTEKMGSVMNLIITGEIGGAADYDEKTGESRKYRLPKRTIIIGSGNPRTQKSTSNFNIVNTMDIATAERFHRTLLLEYDAHSWLRNYANKPFIFTYSEKEYKLFTRIAPIINYFIIQKSNAKITKEGGGGASAPFEIKVHPTTQDTEDHERTLSPRSWTLISDSMLVDAIFKWNKMKATDKKKFAEISEKRFDSDEFAFTIFFNQPRLQVELLFNQYAEFGTEASKILREISTSYNYYSINRIRPIDILYKYAEVRDKVKEKAKEQSILFTSLVASVGRSLLNLEEKSSKNIMKIAVNLSTFFKDLPQGAEDLAMFIQLLKVKNPKNKAFREKLEQNLLSASPKFKTALGNYRYSEGISLKKKDEEETKKKKEAAAAAKK